MTAWFISLTLVSYLLGSLPLNYLVAKRRGIDLRKYGTGQVGAGNLWRMTSSWKLGLSVGIFDLTKGLLMVWAARSVGLGISQQVIVGIAAIIGHNWPAFLKFTGGRGVGTAVGVILILPIINGLSLWVFASFAIITIVGTLLLRSSPLPVLVGLVSTPLVSWGLNEPLAATTGYAAILLVIVIKRLSAPKSAQSPPGWSKLIYRLLFDRDISDGKSWMYRKPEETKKD